jgi:hypothetical protein
MRITLLAVAALGAAGTLRGQGKTDFEFRRDLAVGKRLSVENVIGNVRVTGGPGRSVEITAVKRAGRHGAPEDVSVEVVELSDGVAVCVRYPGQHSRRRDPDDGDQKNPCRRNGWSSGNDRNDTEVTFTVRVPDGLRLHLGTVSGDVTAERLDGELEIESVSGDVRLAGGKGPSIEMETVSGDVTLLDGRAKGVSGHTVSGNVVFEGPVLDSGSYDFSTTSGDIRLTLPERPNATLSAATFSGEFSSDVPTTQDTGRRRRHRFNATWGTGTARLDIESLSGDIRILTGSR